MSRRGRSSRSGPRHTNMQIPASGCAREQGTVERGLQLRHMPGSPQRHARVRKRAKATARLPVEMRQQLLDAIYNGKPFARCSATSP